MSFSIMGGGVVQWKRMCFACLRSLVHSPSTPPPYTLSGMRTLSKVDCYRSTLFWLKFFTTRLLSQPSGLMKTVTGIFTSQFPNLTAHTPPSEAKGSGVLHLEFNLDNFLLIQHSMNTTMIDPSHEQNSHFYASSCNSCTCWGDTTQWLVAERKPEETHYREYNPGLNGHGRTQNIKERNTNHQHLWGKPIGIGGRGQSW